MARPKLIEGPEAASMIKCSVQISPGVSREKQNNICVRGKQNNNCKGENYLFCEAVDNLAQSC